MVANSLSQNYARQYSSPSQHNQSSAVRSDQLTSFLSPHSQGTECSHSQCLGNPGHQGPAGQAKGQPWLCRGWKTLDSLHSAPPVSLPLPFPTAWAGGSGDIVRMDQASKLREISKASGLTCPEQGQSQAHCGDFHSSS